MSFLDQEIAIPETKESVIAEKEMEQKSFEWHLARIDKFTGSKIPSLMKQGRGKGQEWGETAKGVIMEMFTLQCMTDEGRAEWIYQQMRKDFVQTRWGNEHENAARNEYMELTGNKVEVTGFTVNPKCDYHGGSFDGITEKGIIEIKCPFDPVKHMSNISLSIDGLDNSHEYYGQIQSNIEVAGVDWCDFISFDPRQGEKHRIAIIRVVRDQIYIDAMMKRIYDAKSILDKLVEGYSIDKAINLITAQGGAE